MTTSSLFKFKNGVIVQFVNISDDYLSKIKSEFMPKLVSSLDTISVDATFSFSDDEVIQGPLRIHHRPVAYDDKSAFFIDQKDHICRFNFLSSNTAGWFISVAREFDIHFFYIVVLYVLSIRGQEYSCYYLHSAALSFNNTTTIFPAWRHAGKTQLILELQKYGSEILSDDGIFVNKTFEFSSVSCMGHWVYYNLIAHPELLDLLTDDEIACFNLAQSLVADPYCSDRLSDHIKSITRFRTQVVPPNQFNTFYTTNNIVFLDPDLLDKDGSPLTNENFFSLVHSKIYWSTIFELQYFYDLHDVSSSLSGTVDSIVESSKQRLSIFLDSYLQSVNLYTVSHPDSALHEHKSPDSRMYNCPM